MIDTLIKCGTQIPILLDGNSHFREEILNEIASEVDRKVNKLSYDEFMRTVPHLKYEKEIIYIPDFLPEHLGRIFNEYEISFMSELSSESNIIVLGTKDLTTVPFKDNQMLKSFQYFKLPTIKRKHILYHIKNMIFRNGYDKSLITLPWDKLKLESLSFEMINMLLYDVAMLKSEFPSEIITLDSLSFIVNDMRLMNDIMDDFRY